MRNFIAPGTVAVVALLALSSGVSAQVPAGRGRRALPPGYVADGVPEMPNPPGPAPKPDLTGVWVGPLQAVMGPYPALTPAGDAKLKRNKPIARASDRVAHLEPNNDPFAICDPLGFPRDLLNHTLSSRGGIWFQPAANDRMLILFEQQRVWREVWTDGRQLPAKIDAPGAPDSRYYGYSVGHWEGDNVFVIDTTGVDENAWLDEAGHPHSSAAKLQERWTRLDQYHLEATVTVNDPKYYTQPFQLMKTDYYWKKDQDVEEELCIASEAIEYQKKLANPSGWGPEGAPAK
jgi:hypothetical protein